MSRLAGAGGAAECALMNAQPSAALHGRLRGCLCGNFSRSHRRSLQAKCGAIKPYSFFLNFIFYWVTGLKIAIVDILHFMAIAQLK